jgi:uncharacterized sulfatase
MQFDGSRPQLYDLEKDPSESINLAEQQPERVTKFRDDLNEWNKQFR